MERNPWKIATIGLALVGTTALGTGLTTAWMMRPPAQAIAQEAPAVAPQAPIVRHAAVTARPVTPAVAPTVTPRVTPVSTAATPADCATGGERALRIAKPGLVGALLGAGLGAAGGAIADGGKAAGKGALIGGLAGAALGGGYGAYKTKNECGTILGHGLAGSTPAHWANASQATFGAGQGITVSNVR